jgi:hypothetical protein
MSQRHHGSIDTRPGHAAALLEVLRSRAPRPEAAAHVRVSAPPSRTCYQTYTRIAGPRADVLDYAAYLIQTENTPADGTFTHLVIESIEEEGDEMTLLLSRATYGG